jgi:hypothetical protein
MLRRLSLAACVAALLLVPAGAALADSTPVARAVRALRFRIRVR